MSDRPDPTDPLKAFVDDMMELGWTPFQIARNIQDKERLKWPPVAPTEDDEPDDDEDDDDRSACGVDVAGIERALRELVMLQRDQLKAIERIEAKLIAVDARTEQRREVRSGFWSNVLLILFMPITWIVLSTLFYGAWWLGGRSVSPP
jgi:hypothetical protein